jgi:poly(beta-D-mannuronate) lyase
VRKHATSEQHETIGAWLKAMSARARAPFDRPGTKRNNHWYWLGLGLGATAITTDDAALWKEAREILRTSLAGVAADGTLPLELAREARALHYHGFALMPLMALAELAASKGEPLTPDETAAVDRLVDMTAKGFADPKIFEELTGKVQEDALNPGSGWMQIYQANNLGRLQDFPLETASGHRWLGGNVYLLRDALGRKSAAQR